MLTINEKLPSLNEYINQCRRNKYAGNKFKQGIEEKISYYIYKALSNGEIHKLTKPVEINISWFEKTKRRDVDNIQSGQKYILDALQKTGVLPNDSRKWVTNISHKVLDADENKVIVEFKEVI